MNRKKKKRREKFRIEESVGGKKETTAWRKKIKQKEIYMWNKMSLWQIGWHLQISIKICGTYWAVVQLYKLILYQFILFLVGT